MQEVWFVTDGPVVKAFVVKLEALIDGEYHEVVRFDGAHGRPHRDTLDWYGKVIHKQWAPIGTTNNQALTNARRDIRENADRYVDAFLRRRP